MSNGDKSFNMAQSFGLNFHFTAGTATGDYNNDGFPDVVIANSTLIVPGAQILLENSGGTNNWITVRTVGTQSNRDGIGARVKVQAGKLSAHVKERRAGSSVLSTSSPWLTFGLGEDNRERVNVTVKWPSGLIEKFQAQKTRTTVTVTEGRGIAQPVF